MSGTGTALDGATLNVPAGALSIPVALSLSLVLQPDSPEGLTIALGPDGTSFAVPAALTLPLRPTFFVDNAIESASEIRVALRSADGLNGEALAVTSFDPASRSVTVLVPHFSQVTVSGDATAPTFFRQLIPRTGRRVPIETAAAQRILVLVHGACDSGAEFDRPHCKDGLVRALEEDPALIGRYAGVYLFEYGWKRGVDGVDGETAAARRPAQVLADALRAFSGQGRTVDLVGHALGGLVCRYALEQKDPARAAQARVGTVVLLATPSAGVPEAALRQLCNPLTQTDNQAKIDLTGASRILPDLASSAFDGIGVSYASLAGDVDGTGADGLAAVTSVQLDEPGSRATRPTTCV